MSDLMAIMSQAAQEMTLSLAKIRTALDHNLSKGEAAEESVRSFFRRYLPASLGVTKGQVIDSKGQRTRQLDVIIYDVARTPMLFSSDEDGHRLVPVEGVLAVIEVKTKVGPSDAEGIVKNMLSVKQLSKSAYFPQGSIQRVVTSYGRQWDHTPTLYALFALESGDLKKFNTALKSHMTTLPLWERVDIGCLLSKGVLVNEQLDGMIATVGSSGSSLKVYESPNALLIFYLMLSEQLLQTDTRPIAVKNYIPQDLRL
ncbi:DUF6602 domain-containing protein [Blastococcus sp. KM273129]|uniref:DUF6602 domain-containing protein n=1 Tax=Blastococcus sp. KM273129 TaxID=2570315 RepID=UPI001F2360A3|nr:DUF6602 domain-containing protein [Blastococcus sp. KM273129]MCF6734881.1 hypothetical protein [Blastococcus sp. KM273129]